MELSPLAGKQVTISGWGRTETGRSSSILLKQVVKIKNEFGAAKIRLTHRMGHGVGPGDRGGNYLFHVS